MGQYSYSQPSSSEEYPFEAEAELYADEAESSHDIVEPVPVHYPLQPEVEDGIPKTCYCGGDLVVATADTSRDPGRRYFTCERAGDGDCHVWKWWDVAVTEEMSEFERQFRQLQLVNLEKTAQAYETQQKLVNLEKRVAELAQKNSGVSIGFPLGVGVIMSALLLVCMGIMFKWYESVLL